MTYVKYFLIVLTLLIQTVSAQSVDNPKITYFHNDITGTPIAASDEHGEVIWREQRRAYGEIKVDPLKPKSLAAFSVGYTGHQADRESGLTYAKARYYNKEIGRFYAPDPIPFRESDLTSINRYAYAANNPYKYVDPDGEAIWFALLIFVSKEAASEALEYVTGIPMPTVKNGIKYGGKKLAKSVLSEGVEKSLKDGSYQATATVAKKVTKINKPYKRPSNATTKKQREFVQGKPCVDCQKTTAKQFADHKEPLIKEYYRTGTIDKEKMRSLEAVQPQCPSCSGKQGASLSRFSKEQKDKLGLNDKND